MRMSSTSFIWFVVLIVLVSFAAGYYVSFLQDKDFKLIIEETIEIDYGKSDWKTYIQWDCSNGFCSNGNPRGSNENGINIFIPREIRCNATSIVLSPMIVPRIDGGRT